MIVPFSTWLRKRHEQRGPLPLEDVLQQAAASYYDRLDGLGREGDFVTAPELTQMFGEIIGAWCIEVWRRMNRPNPFLLVELGPGLGTLMTDLLYVARADQEFMNAAKLHLVEISEKMRAAQGRALQQHNPIWHADISTLPDGPALIIGNEFMDALPIRQYVADGGLWRERLVSLDGEGRPVFLLAEGGEPGAEGEPPGSVREVSPQRDEAMYAIAKRLRDQGGSALLFDYGRDPGDGDTLQAVRGHKRVDVVETLGEADVSSRVDFAALARAVGRVGMNAQGPVDQGVWLTRLGLAQRAQALREVATPTQAQQIEAAALRLVHPEAMGSLFKAFAVASPALGPLPGFVDY